MARNRRELQKEQTRARILDVAYHRFAQKGIDAASTAEIASAAGLSHGALFVHFTTRQDIVLSVIDRFAAELCDEIDRAIGRRRNARSILLAFAKALAAYEAFYAELLLALPKLPNRVQGSILLVQNGFAQHLLPALESEMDSQRFARLGRPLIVNSWFALLHYYLMNRNWYSPTGALLEESAPKIIDEYLELISLRK